MKHLLIKAALGTGIAALALNAPAQGAAYIKLGDIKGESTAHSAGDEHEIEYDVAAGANAAPTGPKRLAPFETEDIGARALDDDDDGDWILVEDLRWAPRDAASGLATGKRDAASGLPTGKRQHKPVSMTKEMDKASPKMADACDAVDNDCSGGDDVSLRKRPGRTTYSNKADAEYAALLLPAVQKAREAVVKRPAGMRCDNGMAAPNASLMDDDTGEAYPLKDAVISACSADMIVVQFRL